MIWDVGDEESFAWIVAEGAGIAVVLDRCERKFVKFDTNDCCEYNRDVALIPNGYWCAGAVSATTRAHQVRKRL